MLRLTNLVTNACVFIIVQCLLIMWTVRNLSVCPRNCVSVYIDKMYILQHVHVEPDQNSYLKTLLRITAS